MATVAIGDIHGNSRALENLLDILPEMKPADTLVFLGDFIDRGPDTKHRRPSSIGLRHPSLVLYHAAKISWQNWTEPTRNYRETITKENKP